jgi:hypothetical protein
MQKAPMDAIVAVHKADKVDVVRDILNQHKVTYHEKGPYMKIPGYFSAADVSSEVLRKLLTPGVTVVTEEPLA